MSFLDRFKPQPRWKHADPAVRLEAVPTIPDDDEHLRCCRNSRARTPTSASGAPRAIASPASKTSSCSRRPKPTRTCGASTPTGWSAIANAPAPTDAAAALALEGLDRREAVRHDRQVVPARYRARGGARADPRDQAAQQRRPPCGGRADGRRCGGADCRSSGAPEHRGEDRTQGRRPRGARTGARSQRRRRRSRDARRPREPGEEQGRHKARTRDHPEPWTTKKQHDARPSNSGSSGSPRWSRAPKRLPRTRRHRGASAQLDEAEQEWRQ